MRFHAVLPRSDRPPRCGVLAPRAAPGQRRACRLLIRIAITLFLGAVALAVNSASTRHTEVDLERPDWNVHLSIDFYDHVRQAPQFYSGSGSSRMCWSAEGGPCAPSGRGDDRWVGAFAIVHFLVKTQTSGSLPPRLRERVRILDHDAQIEDKPVFEKQIVLVDGIGSDIQLFGSREERFIQRKTSFSDASDCLWSLLRQELYYGNESTPFAILHWRHSLDQIRLVDVIPVGQTQLRPDH